MSLNKDFDEWREYGYVRGMPRILLAGAWHVQNYRGTQIRVHQGTVQSERGGVGRRAGENKTNSPRSLPPQIPRALNL